MAHLQSIFDYVDKNEKLYIDRLAEVVAIESVSAFAAKRDEVIQMVHHTTAELKKLGCTAEEIDVGW